MGRVTVPRYRRQHGMGGVVVRRLDAELAGNVSCAVEVRRGEAVRLLQDLVRVPSVTGEEGVVQEVVERAFRERGLAVDRWEATPDEVAPYLDHVGAQAAYENRPNVVGVRDGQGRGRSDRKSTRLNSSHANISYAVFCL